MGTIMVRKCARCGEEKWCMSFGLCTACVEAEGQAMQCEPKTYGTATENKLLRQLRDANVALSLANADEGDAIDTSEIDGILRTRNELGEELIRRIGEDELNRRYRQLDAAEIPF